MNLTVMKTRLWGIDSLYNGTQCKKVLDHVIFLLKDVSSAEEPIEHTVVPSFTVLFSFLSKVKYGASDYK